MSEAKSDMDFCINCSNNGSCEMHPRLCRQCPEKAMADGLFCAFHDCDSSHPSKYVSERTLLKRQISHLRKSLQKQREILRLREQVKSLHAEQVKNITRLAEERSEPSSVLWRQ